MISSKINADHFLAYFFPPRRDPQFDRKLFWLNKLADFTESLPLWLRKHFTHKGYLEMLFLHKIGLKMDQKAKNGLETGKG